MIINIYWSDLSDEGKEALIENGFILTEEIEKDLEKVGILQIK